MRRVLASIAVAAFVSAAAATAVQAQSYAGGYFAVINANGKTVRSSGVDGSKRNNTGNYTVTFARPLNSCGYTGTVTGANAGLIAVAPQSGKSGKLIVRTFSALGQPANRAFVVMVECAPGASPN